MCLMLGHGISTKLSSADTCRGRSTSKLTEVKSHKRYASSHRERKRERDRGRREEGGHLYTCWSMCVCWVILVAQVCPLQQQLQMNDFFVLSAECWLCTAEEQTGRGERLVEGVERKSAVASSRQARGRCQSVCNSRRYSARLSTAAATHKA